MTINRNLAIDITKGIGILLVIIGHVYAPHIIRYVVCSFHMPLFFILSGYFFNQDRELHTIMHRGVKKLLLPYALTCLVVVCIQAVLGWVDGKNVLEVIKIWIEAAFYGLGGRIDVANVRGVERIGAIWFFEALFWAQIGFFFVLKIKQVAIQLGVIITSFIVVLYFSRIFWLPFNIGTGITSIGFLFAGYYVRKNNLLKKETKRWPIVCLILSAVTIVIDYKLKMPFVPAYLQYPLFGLDVLGGISGTYLTFCMARIIEKKNNNIGRLLGDLGYSSSHILCFHLVDQNCLGFIMGRIKPNIVRLIIRMIFDTAGGLSVDYILKIIRSKGKRIYIKNKEKL